MKKALIHNPTSSTVAASDFLISVYHKNNVVDNLKVTNYTYEDAFEYIKEKYPNSSDYIKQIIIQVEK